MPTRVLLIIDVQRSLVDAPNPVPDASTILQNLSTVLAKARDAKDVKVIWIRHNNPTDPEFTPHTTPWEIMETATFKRRSDELIVEKTASNSFQETDLEARIAEILDGGKGTQVNGVRDGPEELTLTLAGVQSDFCVQATAKGALSRYPAARVELVSGAHGTYAYGGKSAGEVAREIEEELGRLGVRIVEVDELRF